MCQTSTYFFDDSRRNVWRIYICPNLAASSGRLSGGVESTRVRKFYAKQGWRNILYSLKDFRVDSQNDIIFIEWKTPSDSEQIYDSAPTASAHWPMSFKIFVPGTCWYRTLTTRIIYFFGYGYRFSFIPGLIFIFFYLVTMLRTYLS